MSSRPYFLGVDGGGTKTEFLCLDRAGAIVARHIGPTTYHPQVGVEGVRTVIAEGVAAIRRALDAGPDAFEQVFIGLPAYGEDSVVDPQLHALCGTVLGHDRYGCGNDMVCGWAGSLGCADGINIVAGTGSIGYGERRGRSARVGGWGEMFGDEGSAYWIAIQGLNAFTRMSDGRLPRGPLHAAFVAALDLGRDLDICARILGPDGMERDAVAALARVVNAAAEAGDDAAQAIFDAAARELVNMVDALRETLGFEQGEPVPVSWSGGVLTEIRAVSARFAARLESASRGYRLETPRHRPAYGAALYAAHMAGTAIPDDRAPIGT